MRWDSPVGRPLLELAILTTAREHDQPYEWSLHETEAVAVGLDLDAIDVVRHRRPLTGLGDRETVIVQAGREIFGTHHLNSETYQRAVSLLGETNFVDVVNLMARYAGTAARLTAFNQHMPSGWPQFLPLPVPQSDGACAVGCWWCERIPLQEWRLRHIRHPAQVTGAILAVTYCISAS